MPNHVANVIKMKGIRNLPLFSVDEEGYQCFDFNKLIPMPESMDIDHGSMTDDAIVYYLTERCIIPIQCLEPKKRELLEKVLKDSISSPEEMFKRVHVIAYNEKSPAKTDQMYEDGKTYISNFQKYGATTWYDWCCREWGTKWNAYDLEVTDEDRISFKTAWCCPEPVIRKLAERYPDAKIEHWWADEDEGYNSGYMTYEKGEVQGGYDESDSTEAYERYEFCWS